MEKSNIFISSRPGIAGGHCTKYHFTDLLNRESSLSNFGLKIQHNEKATGKSAALKTQKNMVGFDTTGNILVLMIA